MVSSEKLLQATLNRLSARLGEKLIVSINELKEVIKDAPEKVRSELELFQDEVYQEAERLQKDSSEGGFKTNKSESKNSQREVVHERIEQIRAKIEKISNQLEAGN